MVQFNLLPDIKLEFVKARRTKYLMTFISLVVSAAAIAVLLFSFFVVNVVQKKSLKDIQKDITSKSKELKGIDGLDKILTVQNQLGTLTSLHETKPVNSRLFGYITQVTPAQASLNKLNVDYAKGTITISGTAPNLDTVSIYTDTLKTTRLRVTQGENGATPAEDVCPNLPNNQKDVPDTLSIDKGGNCSKPTKAFSEVVLSSFGRDDKGATFTISFKYDPVIFDKKKTVSLLVSTGSMTNQANLFGTGQ